MEIPYDLKRPLHHNNETHEPRCGEGEEQLRKAKGSDGGDPGMEAGDHLIVPCMLLS